jgi:hypothetical protein
MFIYGVFYNNLNIKTIYYAALTILETKKA